ncbi:hypothetical protein ACI65C_002104 [Semiaphis heraclei]
MKAGGARGSLATVAGFDENNRVVPITSKPRKKLTEMALTPGNEAGGQVGRVWCVLSFVVTEKPPKPPSPPSDTRYTTCTESRLYKSVHPHLPTINHQTFDL